MRNEENGVSVRRFVNQLHLTGYSKRYGVGLGWGGGGGWRVKGAQTAPRAP